MNRKVKSSVCTDFSDQAILLPGISPTDDTYACTCTKQDPDRVCGNGKRLKHNQNVQKQGSG